MAPKIRTAIREEPMKLAQCLRGEKTGYDPAKFQNFDIGGENG